MSSEEAEKPISAGPQVFIAIAVVMLALALPITCVILAIRPAPRPQATPAATVDPRALDGLRANLERAAEQSAPTTSLDPGKKSVEIHAKDVGVEWSKIENVARSFNASAFVSAKDDRKITVLVQVPTDKLASFLKACGQTEAFAANNSGASELLEIMIIKTP